MTQQQFLTGGQMTHESEITLRTQRAEKIGQHGAAFVFQNAPTSAGRKGKRSIKRFSTPPQAPIASSRAP